MACAGVTKDINRYKYILIILHFYLYATFTQHSKKIHALLLKSKTREKYFGGVRGKGNDPL